MVQRAENLICRDVVETEGVLLPTLKARPVGARSLKQHLRADDIGADKLCRPVD